MLGSADNGSIYFFIPDSLIRAVKVAEGGDKIYKIESLGHTDRQKIQLLVSVRNKGIRLVEIRTDLLEAQVIKTFLCDTTNISPKKLNRYSAYDWIYSPKDKARYIATSNGLWKITEKMHSRGRRSRAKPPHTAGRSPLDSPLPPVLDYGRRRGI